MKMLPLAIATILSSSTVFAAGLKTLANTGDFAVLSDENSPSVKVFLSYTGVNFDHCGIAVRTSSWGLDGAKLASVLEITTGANQVVSELVKDVYGQTKLVAKVANPNSQKYGQNFHISSISGESLTQAIGSLSNDKVDVIVEILSCK